MANVEQFEKAVTEAGAVAMRIMRGPRGAERLIVQTPGGLITREVPLTGGLMSEWHWTQLTGAESCALASDERRHSEKRHHHRRHTTT